MKYIKVIKKTVFWGLTLFLVFTFLSVLIMKFAPAKYPNSVTLCKLSQLCDDEKIDVKHEWVDMKDISPYMKYALVCCEDCAFWKHNGISIKYIRLAYYANKDAGKIVSGGSTISQQTAKNVFLYPNRTYLRKGLELWFTMLEEWIWGKERILEVYMNSIEFGKGIYGIEAAAKHFYGVPAKELSLEQCVLLTGILPSPLKHDVHEVDDFLIKRIKHCLKYMHKYNYINDEQYEELRKKYE